MQLLLYEESGLNILASDRYEVEFGQWSTIEQFKLYRTNTTFHNDSLNAGVDILFTFSSTQRNTI